MPMYEHVFLGRQDLSTAQMDGLAEQFTQMIEAAGGKVTKTEYWGLRSLTYRIKKNRKAHYMLLNVDAPAGTLHEVERNANINEDVIRFLTVRVDELQSEPSAMMRRDRERSDRDRGDRPDRGDRDRGDRDRGDRDRGDRGDRGPRRGPRS